MNKIRSIGIIMDGNRRWAKARGLLLFEGHRAGLETLKKLLNDLPRLKKDYGLTDIALYGLSTENWDRSKEELSFLMDVFAGAFAELLKGITEGTPAGRQFRVRVAGQKERFPERIQALMAEAEAKTADFTEGTIFLCLSYGGRAEILDAAAALTKNSEAVTEENFSRYLWTAGMEEPDLIVRTGGERRLSNFLTWQSVYSELFFTDTLWPDFSTTELERIFAEFQTRERRHGK